MYVNLSTITSMIKILIADDHAVVRRGLRQIISDESDFEVVAEAQNGQEVLDQLEKSDCNVVVLDITMPDKNGLAVLQEVKAILKAASLKRVTIGTVS